MTEIKRYRRKGILNGDQLLKDKRPKLGFFIKTRDKYSKDGEPHTHFHWTPVSVGEIWVTDDNKKCQVHFIVTIGDKTTEIDQPISRPKYESFRSFQFEIDCIDLIDSVLKRNRQGLCLRRRTKERKLRLKIMESLYSELYEGRKTCGQSMNEYCIGLLSGKQPKAALTNEEIDLLKHIKKVRSDVQLMFNAMVTEFGKMSDAEIIKIVIQGKGYDWWRDYLITALETLDNFVRRLSYVSD